MLKGKSVIELRNAETGKIEQVIEDENMVTNAVSNIINHEFDVNFDNAYWSDKVWWCLLPIWQQCFGGLLLFDGNITENVENIIAPASVKQVGHACNPYTGANPERGTLNSVESKSINNGKGYRFVWDFGSDKANGTIRSACLTSYAGGILGQYGQYTYNENGGDRRHSFNGIIPFINYSTVGKRTFCTSDTNPFGGFSTSSAYSLNLGKFSPIGFFKNINTLVTAKYGAASDYLKNAITFKEIEFSKEPISIFGNSPMKRIEKEVTVTSSKKFCSPLELFSDEEKIYSLAATSKNTFDFIVINGTTLRIEREETITLQDATFVQYPKAYIPNKNNYNNYPDGYYFKGYYYIKCASQWTEFVSGNTYYAIFDHYYKINAGNLSDYSVVNFDMSGCTNPCTLDDFGGALFYPIIGDAFVYSTKNKIMLDDGTILTRFLTGGGVRVKNKFLKKPIFLFKNINAHDNYDYNSTLYTSVYNAYLGTINNLTTPVVKNETQTMKVTYEITEV